MAKKKAETTKAESKKSEEPRKEPAIGEIEPDKSAELSSESVILDESVISATGENADDSQYSTQFISFAASVTSSLRKLDERIALLDEHHTNIELLIGAANRTVEKQRLYALGSAAITVGGLIISAIIVVIAATTIGGFNRQFMSLSEAMMAQITDLNTGVEYLELTQDSIASLQNNVSEMVVESRMGLEALSQALQDSASRQSESSTQLANTINEANQYDYQSLVGLSDSIQSVVGRLSDLESQMTASERQVQQLTTASESIGELNSVVQALLVLEQEKYLEVLENLAPSEDSSNDFEGIRFFRSEADL
jgi:methyl-accepting chemotaxis protein